MSPMSQLTPEQAAVVASQARLLAVDAFAGSGKTKTLVEYARARPRQRILYIAFNKSVATEARERFPDHVDCRTTHSLAYAAVGKTYQRKLGNVQPFEVARLLNCSTRHAKIVIDTIQAWLSSTSAEIGADHVDRANCDDLDDIAGVVDDALKVWAQMRDPETQLRMSHDGYLKLWALQSPRLAYDIILLDEAQDTNPVTLGVVLAQKRSTLVLVGDRHQGIYGFRKAMNAMEAVDADERIALTQSFRFGQSIADVATALLRAFKSEAHPVLGRSDLSVSWRIDESAHHVRLGRTNAGLFGSAARVVLDDGDRRLHFVGGFDSYPFGKVLDAYHLWSNQAARIKDAGIARFANFADFAKYGEEASDAEVKALVRVVNEYRQQVPQIYNAMKAAEVADEGRAHLTLTTAHRAKGLEWDQVYLADDFIELPPKDDFDPEEVNLLYVAVTRAIRAVRLPLNLVGWLRAQDDLQLGLDSLDAVHLEPERLANSSTPSTCAWTTDDGREDWLREHAGSLGEAAAGHIAFLLRQLDEARLVMA